MRVAHAGPRRPPPGQPRRQIRPRQSSGKRLSVRLAYNTCNATSPPLSPRPLKSGKNLSSLPTSETRRRSRIRWALTRMCGRSHSSWATRGLKVRSRYRSRGAGGAGKLPSCSNWSGRSRRSSRAGATPPSRDAGRHDQSGKGHSLFGSMPGFMKRTTRSGRHLPWSLSGRSRRSNASGGDGAGMHCSSSSGSPGKMPGHTSSEPQLFLSLPLVSLGWFSSAHSRKAPSGSDFCSQGEEPRSWRPCGTGRRDSEPLQSPRWQCSRHGSS